MKPLLVLVLYSAIAACAHAQNVPLTLDKTIPMPKVEGRIDHMAADVAGQRLFVAALGNNTVEVLDLKAGLLGIEPFYIPVLVSSKLLKPVGKPVASGRKFFARARLLELSTDESWLNKVAIAMVNFNRGRNRTSSRPSDSEL